MLTVKLASLTLLTVLLVNTVSQKDSQHQQDVLTVLMDSTALVLMILKIALPVTIALEGPLLLTRM